MRRQAYIKGVIPSLFFALTSAPAFIKTSLGPYIKGVLPPLSLALTFAPFFIKNDTISDIGIDIVKSLIRAGANINEVDKDGNSALLYLLYTIRSGIDSVFGIYETVEEYEEDSGASLFLELIKFLIDNGANVNIRNKEGETPLSLSKEFPKLTKFLKDNGAYLQ